MAEVETFEIEKQEASGPVLDEGEETEMLSLIDQCGLKGQQELLSYDEETEGVGIIPYRILDPAHKNRWDAVCPHHVEVEKYQGAVMPLRVLQVIAYAQKAKFFDRIEVWSQTSDKVTDPVLIGKISSGQVFYLLARWADELWPVAELYDRAKKALTERWSKQAKNGLAKIEAFDFESKADEYLEGEYVSTPWY